MKTVTMEEIRYLGRLARLQIDEEDLEELSTKISKVLEYMSKLNKLEESEKLPPDYFNYNRNVFRVDQAFERFDSDNLLSRSPDPDKEYFRVPKVIS